MRSKTVSVGRTVVRVVRMRETVGYDANSPIASATRSESIRASVTDSTLSKTRRMSAFRRNGLIVPIVTAR